MYPKYGEIWLVNLDPTIGAEIRKTRPAVICSNNQNNKYSLTITVLPITDKGKEIFPFEAYLSKETKGLKKDSKVKCQQIRTIDKRRLIKKLGNVDKKQWSEIKESLVIHLGLN